MGGYISQHDLKFEAKLWLELVCARIMPFKNDQRIHNEAVILIACLMTGIRIMPFRNDQRVHNEVAILIACLMTGIHINYSNVLVVQFW